MNGVQRTLTFVHKDLTNKKKDLYQYYIYIYVYRCGPKRVFSSQWVSSPRRPTAEEPEAHIRVPQGQANRAGHGDEDAGEGRGHALELLRRQVLPEGRG